MHSITVYTIYSRSFYKCMWSIITRTCIEFSLLFKDTKGKPSNSKFKTCNVVTITFTLLESTLFCLLNIVFLLGDN